jgi:hypothetical protein
MPKETANFTALGQRFLAHYEGGATIAAIYRGAREALGWDRDEWRGRIPNDDPPPPLLAKAGQDT